jgi:hypothetical protein
MTTGHAKTDGLVLEAYRKKATHAKLYQWEKVLLVLADGRWHGAPELTEKVTHRFSDAVMKARSHGAEIRIRLEPGKDPGLQHYQYALGTEPDQSELF